MAGTLTISTLSDGTNSTSATNCIQGSAKAWVNFNGEGTVAIRASYNVSSITDNGTGNFQVNFTNAMSDANYSINATSGFFVGSSDTVFCMINTDSGSEPTTTNCKIRTKTTSSTGDSNYVCVSIFR